MISWIAAAVYAALAFVFWGRFVLERGLHAETVWIELSQARPGWAGFLYPYDASRRFMSLPFHAAYLMSDGSYLTMHLLYGAFVFLTGWLTWLLVNRIGRQPMAVIDLPVGWVFSAMLFGFLLMFLRSLQVAWRHWRQGYSVLERPEFPEG